MFALSSTLIFYHCLTDCKRTYSSSTGLGTSYSGAQEHFHFSKETISQPGSSDPDESIPDPEGHETEQTIGRVGSIHHNLITSYCKF